MDKIKFIKRHLKNEKVLLLKALKRVKKARDTAPNAMQSWSDTTRNQNEQFVIALEEKLQNLEKIILTIPSRKDTKSVDKISLWSYVEIELNNHAMKLFIVPEGIGGKEVSNIRLISQKSPLGSSLVDTHG